MWSGEGRNSKSRGIAGQPDEEKEGNGSKRGRGGG